MNFAWLHTASTNVGLAAIATAVAGYFQGSLTQPQLIMAIVGGVVAIVLPQQVQK